MPERHALCAVLRMPSAAKGSARAISMPANLALPPPQRNMAPMASPELERIAARYIRFAEAEARGRSPLYEMLALGVAHDELVLKFLAELPVEKQQPNLFLAALRHVAGTPRDWQTFHASSRTSPRQYSRDDAGTANADQ